ncbi:MAG: S8 family peptidase [Lachnospiraceae bacterium]
MEKTSVELRMAVGTPLEIRKESLDLNVGYDEKLEEWELIIRYTGNIDNIKQELGIEIEELLGGYGITKLSADKVSLLASYPQIDYIEKPKGLYLQQMEGIASSCVNRVRLPDYHLFGTGVLVACIDSGADVYHPDFRNQDGTTRIVDFWDQTLVGVPPDEYSFGVEFTKNEINEILLGDAAFPSFDSSGHGTAVLGIMAGNGNASNGQIVGMAPDADIIVVKLGNPDDFGFPRTTQLMLGIDFVVRRAIQLGKPIAINISFGNNYGDHNGDSIVETYLDYVANLYQLSIVTGSGNEGLTGRHVGGTLNFIPYLYQEEVNEFVVENYLSTFNLQIWKSFEDTFDIYLEVPNGIRIGPFSSYSEIQNYRVDGNRISVLYGEPTPYNRRQEVYISVTSENVYVSYGIWKVIFVPRNIINGQYNMWLPVAGSTSSEVYFVNPTLSDTLVVPGTAGGVITVSGYNSQNATYAAFSGRGKENFMLQQKPDLCAPAVNINTCSVGGGYRVVSGTSFAAPFVTGACALLMEYGIVNGNDIYLYGEKMRAALIKGAVALPFQETVPDWISGYGRLCVSASLQAIG